MRTEKEHSNPSAFQHLRHGIQAVGGLWPWCLAASSVGFVVGSAVIALTAVVNHDLSGADAWSIWKWSFWITIGLCAIATAYLAWNTGAEEDDDEARPER